jgi:hypothetical protein
MDLNKGNNPVLIEEEAVWASGLVWTYLKTKSLSCRDSNRVVQHVAKSLY